MSQKIARLAGLVIAFVVFVLGSMAMSNGSAFAGSHGNVQSLRYQPCSDCTTSRTWTGPGGSYNETVNYGDDDYGDYDW